MVYFLEKTNEDSQSYIWDCIEQENCQEEDFYVNKIYIFFIFLIKISIAIKSLKESFYVNKISFIFFVFKKISFVMQKGEDFPIKSIRKKVMTLLKSFLLCSIGYL